MTDTLTPAAADALRRANDALARIRQAVEIQGKAADDRAIALVDLVEAFGRGGRERALAVLTESGQKINMSRLDALLKEGRKLREERTGSADKLHPGM